ncbi:MAG TPA: amidohydrolase [Candidatus Ozemobacteraceae bacterium]|nr:amidohydrolase [Candidatus Ozemobacteraceae bacterium]
MEADLLLVNGNVWRGGSQPEHQWTIAICGNRIAALGPDNQMKDWRGPRTSVFDCRSRLVLPGFHDAHLHPLIGATDLLDCSLMGLKDWPSYQRHINTYLERHPDASFVRGNGWVHGLFPAPGPHRQLLDSVIPDRPAYFKAMDGHSGWCNTAALRLAGITRQTPNPPGGIIERDPTTGEPTGLLRKMPAMQLVTDLIPQATHAELLNAADAFASQAARFGVTSVQDASGKSHFPAVYLELERSERLKTFRVTLVRRFSPGKGLGQLEESETLRHAHHSPFFRFGPLKLFLDGVIEGETAYLLHDYSDRAGYRGEPVWDIAEWLEMIPRLAERDWAVHVHAVGDAAVRLALDGIAGARAALPQAALRHQIAHADLISDADIPRFADLGVLANLQPSWFARDSNYLGVTIPAIGNDRSEKLYRLRDLYNHRADVAFSSDWPFGGDVTSFDPLIGIETGIRRIHPESHGDPLNPSQSATLTEMLTGFTLGAARAVNREHELGALRPGYLADLIVIEPDLFSVAPEEIHRSRVVLTVVDGSVIYRAD